MLRTVFLHDDHTIELPTTIRTGIQAVTLGRAACIVMIIAIRAGKEAGKQAGSRE